MHGSDDETQENATSVSEYVIGDARAEGLLLPSRTITLAAGDVIIGLRGFGWCLASPLASAAVLNS
jgi:hypothetical protein